MTEQKHLNLWQRCRLALLYSLFYSLSRLPMRALYAVSDILYVLVYKLAGYRRGIVWRNLADAFPEKSDRERKQIERDFYHWFADYLVETIKLTSISPEELKRRMRFENTELPNRLLHEGKPIALLLGHYCNWEWISSMPLSMDTQGLNWHPAQIYHPLENPVVNQLFLRIRSRMGVNNVAMSETLRVLLRARQQQQTSMTGYIADQTPRWIDTPTWVDFLNHPDTAFFTGCERIAKKLNCAVVYLDVCRVRRGYYKATFQLLTEQPQTFPDYALTAAYAQRLEATIRRAPAFWLWSHNRWKRPKEAYERRWASKAAAKEA